MQLRFRRNAVWRRYAGAGLVLAVGCTIASGSTIPDAAVAAGCDSASYRSQDRDGSYNNADGVQGQSKSRTVMNSMVRRPARQPETFT